jgi:zinc transport system substrate-binding protein
MKRTLSLLAATLAATLALGACGSGDTTESTDGRLAVVAAFYPMADAAARVGGARVKVTNLTPVGSEPHDIELTPRQADQLLDADLVVYLGHGFQPAVAELAGRREQGSVDVLDKVQLQRGDVEAIQAEEGSGAGEESGLDPHFWLDPTLMAAAVDEVTEALAGASPDDADTFRANATRYQDELQKLDTEFRAGLGDCDRQEIVTSHAAFYYLARRYHLTQLPITGLSPEAEPDAARLAALADEIEAKGITTVFYEELMSPKVSEALAREAGVRTAVLSPIEGLSREEIDAGKDYAAVMRDNLAALRQALGCR